MNLNSIPVEYLIIMGYPFRGRHNAIYYVHNILVFSYYFAIEPGIKITTYKVVCGSETQLLFLISDLSAICTCTM